RLRGLPQLPARQGHAVDAALPLAGDVLHRRRLLESGRCRTVRLPDQPAAVAVLHAGAEPHPTVWPYCPVRRLWHARHRPGAVLPARPEARRGLARGPAEEQLLVLQHRSGTDGTAHPAAAGHNAGLRLDRAWLLVCALGGVHAAADRRPAGLDAGAGRHHLRHRRTDPGGLHCRPVGVPAPRGRTARAWFRARSCRDCSEAGRVSCGREVSAFYAEIRLVHVAAVLFSGGLFLVRGLGLVMGSGWPRAAPLRYLSYTNDTVLLTAALMLMTIVQQY